MTKALERTLNRTVLRSVCALAFLGCVPAAVGQISSEGDAVVVREPTGERKLKLDRMERQPLNEDVWSALSEWSGSVPGIEEGTPLSPANTRGKVVLFYTWASYYPTSLRPMSFLHDLQEELGDEGLIIVAVHNPQGWEGAAQQLERRRANYISAHDADGTFRELMLVDQDPDFYFIDRAGQLRFADVATTSVENAARRLIEESGDDASTLNERLDAQAAERERLFRRLERIRQSINIERLPRVPFSTPAEAEYDEMDWPSWGIERQRGRRGDEEPSPIEVKLPEEGWTPAKPERHGQGMLLYFWHPALRSSFDREMREMDEIQLAHARDLIVIGAIPQLSVDDRRIRDENQRREVERLLSRGEEALIEMKTGRSWAQWWAEDFDTGFLEEAMNSREPVGQALLGGTVALATSDGKVRWLGSMRSPGFRIALNVLLTKDPGLRARRDAELTYIASHSDELGVDSEEMAEMAEIEDALERLDDEG